MNSIENSQLTNEEQRKAAAFWHSIEEYTRLKDEARRAREVNIRPGKPLPARMRIPAYAKP